jgi:hypothetical protein
LGKLAPRGLVSAVAPGQLVHITDQLSQRRFLVDTGAAYSVFPYVSTAPPNGPALSGAAGQPIPCWGERYFHLSFGGQSFSWSFLLAAVQFPIIGVDFLRHFGLLVDPAANQLVDRHTLHRFQSSAVSLSSSEASTASHVKAPSRSCGAVSQAATCGLQVEAVCAQAASSSRPPARLLEDQSPPSAHRPLHHHGLSRPSPTSTGSSPASPEDSSVFSPPPFSLRTAVGGDFVSDLLASFPDVVNTEATLPAVRHDVVHHIKTSGPPIALRFRRLGGNKLEAARREFEAMERDGIIERSTSPWASPLHMVPKKDGSWRPCGDFWRLNLVTEPDVYPLPNMLDFSERLSGCTIFSKIDLRKGYWQVPVRPEDKPKTAVIMPFGLFQFRRMPFGLRNAGSSFQRMMDRALSGLGFAYCYLDDLRIASPDLQSHKQHLAAVFKRLRDFGLVINREKCVFAVSSFEFLGHLVSAQGARPLLSYVEAVEHRPRPATIKELHIFLGLINFYRRFIPGAASVLKPLTDTLRGSTSGQQPLLWTADMGASFEAAKQALSKAMWLGHPDPSSTLALHVDASASHVGAALHQRGRGCMAWQPLGFFSKKLDTAQTKWSAFDRELYACVEGIRHFGHILEGRAFTIFTDHKPLVGALARASDPWTARQCRHLSYVAEFTSDVQHVAGQENSVADALSLPPVVALVTPPEVSDLHSLASRQRLCPETLEACTAPSLQVRDYELHGVQLLCDFSTGRPRPLVPREDRRKRLICSRFIWPGMKSEIAAWCRGCVPCQRAKITKQPRASVQPIPIPLRRFSHVHVDLVGPLPVSEDGFLYIFTIIDRTTRWLEAVPLKNMATASCMEAFLSVWVARFGVPETVTSDRGAQFSSASWASFCKRLGVRHIMTTAYHPQANGLVERAHRQLKEALKARGAATDWPAHLPWALLGLHAVPKEISGVSSTEAVYGQPLVLPGEVSIQEESPPLAFKIELASPQPSVTCQPRTYAEVVTSTPRPGLQTASFVYVKRGGPGSPLAPAYAGPYRVLRPGPKFFVLEVGGQQETVSVDRLKPHSGNTSPDVAEPPRRGRPPRRPTSSSVEE